MLLGEAFERQHARDIFSRFVPPGVVDEVLARTDDDFRLGGVERDCTVLFSDLRGFTSFSESQPAAKVIEVVNFYLNEMTEAILAAGGTLIAYMGDGIMAVFGAPIDQPDHADRALVAAREMMGPRLQRFNDWLHDQGYESGFRMGIGLNSGTVMAGNVGSAQRVEYTAIGDTTNTASRLEGMTKGTPHMLFISETTRERMSSIPEDMVFVDSFDIRGRVNKMAIYSLPDPEHATVGKPARPASRLGATGRRGGRAGARSGLDLVVVLEPVAVFDAELLRRIADALLWQLVLGGLRDDVAIALGRVRALLGVAFGGQVGLVLGGLLDDLGRDDRVAARHRREGFLLLAGDLGRIGPAPPLQVQVVADRVVEIAHRPTA